jgi:Second Messenger Oligonucleotide or Dinucleotide Synthetase domain
MTVAEAFEIFKTELELPEGKQKIAAAAQQEVREEISKYLDISDSLLAGSYSRHTKINPLNDIDVFLVRNSQRIGLSTGGNVITPNQELDAVMVAVAKAFPRITTTKKQCRSVNVTFNGLDFGFDLIPAWLRSPDGYWIPDNDLGIWVPSSPEFHSKVMTEANNKSGGKLKPVIKMIKHWNRSNLDLLRSFHIELVCADVFKQVQLSSFQVAVATVLYRLPSYVGVALMDPAYGTSRVDRVLSAEESRKLLSRAQYDAGNVVKALKLEGDNLHADGIKAWQHIFLSGFPR